MLKRIKKLIEKKNLTATQFAGEIGVQRSAVSHLLSGRNKASLDFMLKIKNRYPEVNLDWLLLGEGKMIETAPKEETAVKKVQEELFRDEMDLKVEEKSSIESAANEPEIQFSMAKSEDAPAYKTSVKGETDSLPQKIILLYPDNTFKIINAR